MFTVTDIPLNCLVPSAANVRRTSQSLRIEELAASIQNHGLLQNLTVRLAPPDKRTAKKRLPYEVIAGGRRLAALKLLAKRKHIAANTPIACHILTGENATELSLAENALQCPMHPADQFEAFYTLHTEQGMSAEDIAARFGVTPAVVKQRLKLAAISPVLMQAYRDEQVNLDQLTAFAFTDDHATQERVWDDLGADCERDEILEVLSGDHVAATDRRVRFVGLDAYREAGGAILRDLFDDDHHGFLTDVELLVRLTREKLHALAEPVKAEGWKWVEVMPDYDYAATAEMRRVYPDAPSLSDEVMEEIAALQDEYNLIDGDDKTMQAEAERLEQAIAALQGDEVFDAADIQRGGAIVTVGRDGTPRIERGFIRSDDDDRRSAEPKVRTRAKGPAPLSETLIAELTAHRTMALRNALAQRPDTALVAVVHALAAAVFHAPGTKEMSCLGIRTERLGLASQADGIDETDAARHIAARHELWARQLPDNAADAWEALLAMSQTELLSLLAHCASMTVDAVQRRGADASALAHADQLARAIDLDMRTAWTPTVANYLGRISKERILEAVREGVSKEAADNLASLKKQAMAAHAEQRLQGQGWLPPILRHPTPAALAAE